ncbi:maleylpyruvate isomerase family mycothiol-dependent enzyme [Streptomyces sp. NPDC091217]|uniref:maleylpyruvate isomerase family mycothiol-dependent enzyme n=1 Tax=Streptomyces sp. NPDC091217 TaxID=3365975 RepID=UPI00380A3310
MAGDLADVRSLTAGDDRSALLAELWHAWLSYGRKIGPDAWEQHSGIGEWSVKELFGHVARQIGVLEDMLRRATSRTAAAVDFPTAADYFANFRDWREEASALSARTAVVYAVDHSTAHMIAEFERAGDVVALLSESLDQVLPTPFGTATARGYLTTRVVEATVHLVDLQRALGLAEHVPERASEVTALLLLEMCPRQAFIDAATGRGRTDFLPVLV